MKTDKSDVHKRLLGEEVRIILDEFDFSWTRNELLRAKRMWINGDSLEKMAKELRPHSDTEVAINETFLLVFHLSICGEIKKRKGYLHGCA